MDRPRLLDGYVSSGGLGGLAILPQSLAKMAEMTQAFPDREFSGLGGIIADSGQTEFSTLVQPVHGARRGAARHGD